MEQSRILSKKILRKINACVKDNYNEPLFASNCQVGIIGGLRKELEDIITEIIEEEKANDKKRNDC